MATCVMTPASPEPMLPMKRKRGNGYDDRGNNPWKVVEELDNHIQQYSEMLSVMKEMRKRMVDECCQHEWEKDRTLLDERPPAYICKHCNTYK